MLSPSRVWHLSLCAFLAGLAGCGDVGGARDADAPDAPPTVDASDPGDATASDAPSPEDAAIDSTSPRDAGPPLSAGVLTVVLPSTAAPGTGLAVRVFHPGTDGARYGTDGAPVAIVLPGGHNAGALDPETRPQPHVTDLGYVWIQVLLPGGASMDGAASGGRYDFRGPDCQRAAADVMLWAMGRARDAAGLTLRDRLPFVREEVVGVVGSSNGGNLALTTLAEHGSELSGLAFFVAWESPVGDQFWAAELQSGELLNPFYTPGTSSPTEVPWPGLSDALDFDLSATTLLTDPRGGMVRGAGALFLDDDGDGALDAGEFSFRPTGVALDADGALFGALSHELAVAVDAAAPRLFASAPRPAWLASTAGVDAFWSGRDGSLRFAEAHAALPDLVVISLGSTSDHVQRTPDHPHVSGHVHGWLDAGHAFVRLNPDAAYLSRVSGADVASLPDNEANVRVPYPGIAAMLEPEMVGPVRIDPHLIPAGVIEAADRAHTGDRAPDLEADLSP